MILLTKYYMHVSVRAVPSLGQKRLEPLELELQQLAAMWVLGTKKRFLCKSSRVLNKGIPPVT